MPDDLRAPDAPKSDLKSLADFLASSAPRLSPGEKTEKLLTSLSLKMRPRTS